LSLLLGVLRGWIAPGFVLVLAIVILGANIASGYGNIMIAHGLASFFQTVAH
jgi:hypothetical protein